jgi:hypothetical protein
MIPAKLPKELKPLCRMAERLKWTITWDGVGHTSWAPPDGSKPVRVPASPGGGNRAYKNTIAKLRQAGLPVPHRRVQKKKIRRAS